MPPKKNVPKVVSGFNFKALETENEVTNAKNEEQGSLKVPYQIVMKREMQQLYV